MKILMVMFLVLILGFVQAKELSTVQQLGLNAESAVKALDSNQSVKADAGFANDSIRKLVDQIGMSKNTMSDELMESLDLAQWGFGGHGSFPSYQECKNFDPECACVEEREYIWTCYFE